ncbi:division/cell wall cluster transcriptional repressor MraZ [Profundibacterium mesophilum]|uniref:Transcriptional regulator MraZ n=1 Tax=Profundibacterium mesophilum KAUST100406-0324 TaxID=1037889 RepID=A0A921NTW3_9RHOB|nr:cell division/cell wall cluster transcriptional repressor MraZ [Profundibacterium mesophilum]KAF0675445.1 Protein MraZ [Profundibacterium mesophilum KAUST100406-0324]
MLGVFIGEHDNKIDAKGRLSIPAEFRRELEDADPKWESGKPARMVIVYGDERRNYLEVFSVADLQRVHAQIATLPRGSRKRAELQRLYAHQVVMATVDETGRIVLGSKLRGKLDLKDRALVVGNGETFMIWQPETYENDAMPGLMEEDDFDPTLDPSTWLPGGGGPLMDL